MIQLPNFRPHSARSRRFAVLGVLALALFQVSAATHQFEHVADDVSKVCRICLQQERLDETLPVPAASGELLQAELPDATEPLYGRHTAPTPGFRSRAPPA